MKKTIGQLTLFVLGAVLLLKYIAAGASPASAMPLAALTPSAEPPTRTSTAKPSATRAPSPTATPTSLPSATPTSTSSPQPTREPKPHVADPAITKAINVSEARIGDVVDFTLVVTNKGNATAEDVVVTDAMPEFLDVVDANTGKGTIAVDGRTVVITVGSVTPDDVITIHIQARVNEQAQPPGGRNNVSLTTSSGSDKQANDNASVGVAIVSPLAPPTETPSLIPSPVEPSPAVADSAGAAAPAAPQARPQAARLPHTAGEDVPSSRAWMAVLLGTLALTLSLLIRRHGARRPADDR